METQKSKDDMLVEIIMRQTDYSKEIAAEKLIQHNYNILSIIREYMSSSKSNEEQEKEKEQKEKEKPFKSTSQLIYGEIRNMMSDAAAKYRRKKELEEYRQQMYAKMMYAKMSQ